jgi:shikimate dehydrogenase
MTSARTRLLALLGHPVSHSRSPSMMTAALRELGREDEFCYLAFDIEPEQLADTVRALATMRCAGANVTFPHKRAVLSVCDVVDDDARRIGAANVLVPLARGFSAHNTDAPGAARALTESGVAIAGARVLVIGAGGAARAVAVGLAREGARAISVIARDIEQAKDCVRACDGLGARELAAIEWSDADARCAHARADIVVQCTTLGMGEATHVRPGLSAAKGEDSAYVQARAWLAHASAKTVAMDIVYAPVRTAWLEAARSQGMKTVDGLGMLAHQGALALARWCGGAPAASTLRRFLDEGGSDG